LFLEFNYSFKWVDDHKYGQRNQETSEWNGMMGELLAQVSSVLQKANGPPREISRREEMLRDL
jgi:hypothetical protein